MSIPLPTLDALTVATDCAVPWGEMCGDDRSRFCGQCQQRVFDLSALTTAEAVGLLASPAGRPCVRLYRRPDGRVLTADCPAGLRVRLWRRLRRRAAWAASLFAVLLLPACRSATQGMLAGTYGEAVSKPPPLDGTDDRSKAVPAAGDGQSPAGAPNAFAEFMGNESKPWSLSPRVDLPREHARGEGTPTPRGNDR